MLTSPMHVHLSIATHKHIAATANTGVEIPRNAGKFAPSFASNEIPAPLKLVRRNQSGIGRKKTAINKIQVREVTTEHSSASQGSA